MKARTTDETTATQVDHQTGVGQTTQLRDIPDTPLGERHGAPSALQYYQRLANNSPQAMKLAQRAEMQSPTVRPVERGSYKSFARQMRGDDAGGMNDNTQTVVQGVFAFRVNTEDYTINHTRYTRSSGKYLNGNSEHKHVTADSVKDELWTGMDGIRLDQFIQKLMDIVEVYLALPGVDLINAHVRSDNVDEDEVEGAVADAGAVAPLAVDDGLNEPMRENYDAFDRVHDSLSHHASNLFAWKEKFLAAVTARDKRASDAAAFNIQNLALELIENLDMFRDLMPLVNVVSGLQKRGSEREAKAFLKTGTISAKVGNENAALWAFFDFAAIAQLNEDAITESIPWIRIADLKKSVARNTGKAVAGVTNNDLQNAIAGIMLANHIKLTTLSYPAAARNSNFGNAENVRAMLDRNDSPIDRAIVTQYAVGGWDWYKST